METDTQQSQPSTNGAVVTAHDVVRVYGEGGTATVYDDRGENPQVFDRPT